jgi:hypothetical protein
MNTTVGHYETEAPERKQKGAKEYFYRRELIDPTAGTEVYVSTPEYQSLSMRPPQIQERSSAIVRYLAGFAHEAITEHRRCTLVTTDFLIWLPLGQHMETEEEVEGGVFAPQRERRTLFSKRVRLRLSDLPHREPRVTITARMLAVEEEEDG